MAILMTLQVLGGTVEQYDRANEILGIHSDADAPDGLIQHVCGLIDDGVVIFDLWETEDAFNTFFANRLGAALQQAGVPESQPVFEQVHNLVPRGGADSAGVIMELHVDAGADIYDEMASEMPSHQGATSTGPWYSHAAAITGTGRLHVVDLWPSQGAFGAFAEAEIAPAAEGRLDEVTPRFMAVHNVIRGKAASAGS
jgi:hypothetical protein